MKNLIEQKFAAIFKHKGNIGPIAEKSRRNLEVISLDEVNKKGRLHHFIVGHAFKNIDKSIFEYQFDEEQRAMASSNFLKLRLESFNFEGDLKNTIENIRNVNSHYIHTFDSIACDSLNSEFINFLREAFLFSVIQIFTEEKAISYEQYKERHPNSVVKYLSSKFFPNVEHQGEQKKYFEKLGLRDAIDDLLFIDVEEDFDWMLNNEHQAFTVKKGKYLSFYAQLFILALTLYKQEANLLISKIQGFKKNEDSLHYKRDIFTFFSKKVSSQDIHSEEKYLIRFRDIIQYLNKYPTNWDKHLEPERQLDLMTNQLEKHIIEKEVFRSFPTFKQTEKYHAFLSYVVALLFKDKRHLFDFSGVSYSESDKKDFQYELYTPLEVKDLDRKIADLRNGALNYRQVKEKQRLERKRKDARGAVNLVLQKLKSRIEQDLLLKSYGRNQDRFMQIAVRFLAEEGYFGKETCFKMYQFYTTDEQVEYLKQKKKELTKKEFDKLKYHQGKLVVFSTYEDHLKRYPNWDVPFVIENNAIQLQIVISEKDYEVVSIQRALLPYLMEEALYSEGVEGKGRALLETYFNSYLMKDFNEVRSKTNSDVISPLHRKLLPSRYLQHRFEIERASKGVDEHPFYKILHKAKEDEKRYDLLLEKAQKLDLADDFVRKNKGKQFKLRFVKKAWHLLFFKPIYRKRFEEHGHHKSFNITKEEFNDFSKWMFAFDEVPQYKENLEVLFESKKFFTNTDFQQIFSRATSLSDFYTETKDYLEKWVQQQEIKPLALAYDYTEIFEKKIVYINLSHFIGFLDATKRLQRDSKQRIVFRSGENIAYLIPDWYYKAVLPREEYKTNAKLFNKLKKVKLEDAILYELAMRYLHKDETIIDAAKKEVEVILNSTISFDIKDGNNQHLYDLVVPFSKLETLAVLIQHKKEQMQDRKNRKTSYLSNLDSFIYNSKNKDIVTIKGNYRRFERLSFDDLNKINNIIISESIIFSRVHMELEKYYITRFKMGIGKDNRIEVDDIKNASGQAVFKDYYQAKDRVRNKAYHFGVPERSYKTILEEVERTFIKKEVIPFHYTAFEELDKGKRAVCSIFMQVLHDGLFKRVKGQDAKQNRADFEKRYFLEYILK